MSKTKIIVEQIYPGIESTLKKPQDLKKYMNVISKYIDTNSEKLFTPYPSERLFFLDSDKNAIFNCTTMSSKEIASVIKGSEYIKDSWKILNDPVNIASILIARFLMIHKKEKELKLSLTFFSCYQYALLYHKYLKYGANENVMMYTINSLTNKYKIKQVGTLYQTLEHIVMKCHDTYKDELLKGTDAGIATYVSGLRVRINDFLKNITNEYTNNFKNQNYMNVDVDDMSEENFKMADSDSYAVKRIADSAVNKLVTYGPDMELAKIAAQLSNVSQNEIREVVLKVCDKSTDDIHRLTVLILQLFLIENSKNNLNEIHMQKFISQCLDIYKKSNTTDKIVIEIKDILDKWLTLYSVKYKKTNREGTLSNFRKAMFIYFVLHIQINTR